MFSVTVILTPRVTFSVNTYVDLRRLEINLQLCTHGACTASLQRSKQNGACILNGYCMTLVAVLLCKVMVDAINTLSSNVRKLSGLVERDSESDMVGVHRKSWRPQPRSYL